MASKIFPVPEAKDELDSLADIESAEEEGRSQNMNTALNKNTIFKLVAVRRLLVCWCVGLLVCCVSIVGSFSAERVA